MVGPDFFRDEGSAVWQSVMLTTVSNHETVPAVCRIFVNSKSDPSFAGM